MDKVHCRHNGYKCTSINFRKLLNLFIKTSNHDIILSDEFRIASELIVGLKTISVASRALWPYGNVFPLLYAALLQHVNRPNHAPRYSNTSKTTSAKRCREGTFLMISAWLCVIRLTRLTYHNPKLPSEISSVWEPDIFSYWHRRKLCKIKLALLYQCRALPTRPPVVTDVSHQLCKEAYKFALRINTFNSVWSSQVVFCVFKVYTLFMLNSQSNFISSSNHYKVETWPRGINVTWKTLSLLLDTCLQNTIFAILLAHEHLIRIALPLLPVQCCLQTLKVPSQGVWPYCAFQHWMGERGCVWANDLWQWLSIRDKLSIWVSHERTWILAGKRVLL